MTYFLLDYDGFLVLCAAVVIDQSLLQNFVSHVADMKLAQQQARLPTGCDTIDKVLQGESKHT